MEAADDREPSRASVIGLGWPERIASQGQRKSLLFAFKLAAFESLKKVKGFPPLLLLDDIFEKLDENRMKNLLDWVCRENNGQLFITDTHPGRLEQHLAPFSSTRFLHLS